MRLTAPWGTFELAPFVQVDGLHQFKVTVQDGLWAWPGSPEPVSTAELRLAVAYRPDWRLEGDELLKKKREASPRDPWLGWSSPLEIQPFSW